MRIIQRKRTLRPCFTERLRLLLRVQYNAKLVFKKKHGKTQIAVLYGKNAVIIEEPILAVDLVKQVIEAAKRLKNQAEAKQYCNEF